MTEEQFPNGSLDRWLREHAEQADVNPAADGWDTPSPKVWEQVRTGIPRRKKRRMAWLWLLLLLGGVGAGFSIWSNKQGQKNADLGLPQEQVLTVPALAKPQDSQTAFTDPEQEKKYSQTIPASKDAVKKSEPNLLDKSLIFNKKEFAENVKPTAQILPSSPLQAEMPAPMTASKIAADCTLVIPRIQELKDRIPVFPLQAIAPLPPLALSILPQERSLKLPAIISVKSHSKPALYFGLTTGAFFTTSTVKPNNPGNQPNGDEKGRWTGQYGLLAGLAFEKHWSVETGLQRIEMGISAQRRGAFRFRTDQERYNGQRQLYESSARQNLETAFGQVAFRFDMTRRADEPVADQTEVFYALQTEERVEYLRIPLALRYSAGRSRWQWSAAAGLGLNVRSGYHVQVLSVRTTHPLLRDVSALAERRAAGLAGVLVDAQADLRMGYRLSRRCTVLLGPEVRYGLGSMYRNGPFRSYPVSVGGQIGVVWRTD